MTDGPEEHDVRKSFVTASLTSDSAEKLFGNYFFYKI
jgi:hypothetical protein